MSGDCLLSRMAQDRMQYTDKTGLTAPFNTGVVI
jgi:hypothetical protein